MMRILIPFIITTLIYAQDFETPAMASSDSSIVIAKDDSAMSSSNADTLLADSTVNLNLGLEYGYKGYPWGSDLYSLPVLPSMSSFIMDSTTGTAQMTGKLGLDSVNVTFVYSDSGFWKAEINFLLDKNNLDNQINTFLKIEKNITEVYGNPYTTEQTVNGPSSSYSNFLNIKYSRAFFSSSWSASPVRIALILNGLVQQPKTENTLLEGDLSFLRLIYYNPDYMIILKEEKPAESLPSIFELY